MVDEARELTKEVMDEMMGGDDFEFFVAFLDEDTEHVVHVCGYLTRPSVGTLIHLFQELKTDEDFGLPDSYVDTLKVRIFQYKEDTTNNERDK